VTGSEKATRKRIVSRLSWVSSISTPSRLLSEIVEVLKSPPPLCNELEVRLSNLYTFNETVIEGVKISRNSLIIADILCDGKRYEAHFTCTVISIGNTRILYDVDLRFVARASTGD
jgi:predicted metal-dependent RNase